MEPQQIISHAGETKMTESRIASAAAIRSFFRVFAAGFVLTACSSMPPIATDVDYCCVPGTQGIHTFRVEFKDMPEFLKPMLRDEVSIVLDTKGVEYTEGDADATMLMAFVHNPLTSQSANEDSMSESLSQGGDSRFVAEVQMELRGNVNKELIWSGSMTRVHNVAVGSYMHDAPARAAMRQAFINMFADYPDPSLSQLP
jgi:hypothetical protein